MPLPSDMKPLMVFLEKDQIAKLERLVAEEQQKPLDERSLRGRGKRRVSAASVARQFIIDGLARLSLPDCSVDEPDGAANDRAA